MTSVLEIIHLTAGFLAKKGIENPRLEAELLTGHVLGLGRMQLYLQFERPLTDSELDRLRPLVKRRGEREPLQYILGETEFFGVKLRVDRRALIPRPETEHLLERITQQLDVAPERILDLGTGSGAIALGLARHYAGARVTALDVSGEAVELARENAAANGLADRVTVAVSDWFAAVPPGETFDLVVANPPYLSDAEVAASLPEVKDHEPPVALSSGGTGWEALDHIIGGSVPRLRPGGWLAMETGEHHPADLAARMTAAGYTDFRAERDLTGRWRYVFARRAGGKD